MLAQAMKAAFEQAGLDAVALDKQQLDVIKRADVLRTVVELKPQVVVQCAAYTRVDDAEREEERAFAVNATAAQHVAEACNEAGARLLYPSSDYVFDGRAQEPYPPDAPTNPINAYGRSKLAGEQAARMADRHLIVRTSWLYGLGGRNFVRAIAERLRTAPAKVVDDQTGNPSWAPDVAASIVALLQHDARGTYHVTNAGQTTWYRLAVEIARLTAANGAVTPCATKDYPTAAARPAYSALDCSATEALIGPLRPWQAALAEAVRTGAY